MTYTTLQLDIIREFGSKELTEGCYITYTWNPKFGKDGGDYLAMLKFSKNGIYEAKSKNCFGLLHLAESEEELIEIQSLHGIRKEILGHIPHLEDVFRVAEEKNKIQKFEMNVDRNSLGEIGLRFYTLSGGGSMYVNYCIPGYNPSLPLLEQSESTLTQLLTLFKKG